MPNLTIALTKDTSAYRCYVPKSHDGYGGPGNDRQYSSCISPCSYAFCLGAIEETYNKDLPLAIHLKKQKLPSDPYAARNVVKEEPITVPSKMEYAFACPRRAAGGSKIATDRCPQLGPAGRYLRLVTYVCTYL